MQRFYFRFDFQFSKKRQRYTITKSTSVAQNTSRGLTYLGKKIRICRTVRDRKYFLIFPVYPWHRGPKLLALHLGSSLQGTTPRKVVLSPTIVAHRIHCTTVTSRIMWSTTPNTKLATCSGVWGLGWGYRCRL